MDVGSLVRGLQELVVKLLVLVWVSVISLLPAVSSQQKQNISGIFPIELPNRSLHNKQRALCNLFFLINNFIKRIYIPRNFILLKYTTQWVVGYSQCYMCIHPRI